VNLAAGIDVCREAIKSSALICRPLPPASLWRYWALKEIMD